MNIGQIIKGFTSKASAVGVEDLVPALVVFGLIAIVAAVIALILSNFQSNAITTTGGQPGGNGAYGIFIETNTFKGGILVTNALAVSNGAGGGGGAGSIFVEVNQINSGYTAPTLLEQVGGKSTNGGQGGSGTYNVVMYGSNTPALPYNAGVGNACTNDFTGGTCSGSVDYDVNTVLTSTVNVSGNVVVNSRVRLSLQGHSILAGNAVFNSGIIESENGTFGFAGGSGGSALGNGAVGQGNFLSAGGSGGGGQGCLSAGGAGGASNTVTGGAGGASGGNAGTCNSGSAGSIAGNQITQTIVRVMATNGLTGKAQYLAGAGGGGQGVLTNAGYNSTVNGLTSIQTLTSFLSLIALVIVAAVIIAVVLLAFSLGGRNTGGTF